MKATEARRTLRRPRRSRMLRSRCTRSRTCAPSALAALVEEELTSVRPTPSLRSSLDSLGCPYSAARHCRLSRRSLGPLTPQRYLPIANVGRIMKKCLPDTTKVSKDAKECVQECTSEFISFITSEAAERCAVEKRKTINGEDILFAMTTLGFDMYAEVLKVYLVKYRVRPFVQLCPVPSQSLRG